MRNYQDDSLDQGVGSLKGRWWKVGDKGVEGGREGGVGN